MWQGHGMEPAERWAEVPSLGIRVRAMVHGEGRSVLFVHGTPTAGGVFVPLVGHFEGVRSIVVDRPGCGLSEGLDFTGMTPERLRDVIEAWTAAVIETVGNGPVDVVASSAGGMVALVLASRRPELVRSVALLGAPAVAGMKLPLGMRAASVAPIGRFVARRQVTKRDLRLSFRAMGHGDLVAAGGITLQDLEWRYSLSRDTTTYAHEMELLRLVATWRGPRAEWAAGVEDIRSLTVPSLWVAGERDPFAAPERIRSWASHAQAATVRVMEGQGHQPWIDDPAAHARMLEEFWEQAPIQREPAREP